MAINLCASQAGLAGSGAVGWGWRARFLVWMPWGWCVGWCVVVGWLVGVDVVGLCGVGWGRCVGWLVCGGGLVSWCGCLGLLCGGVLVV